MTKTLVVAEKPSVGQDLAKTLPGPFRKAEGYLESDGYVVTWAVGHLVTLAEPDAYDSRYKRWRTADLPILPAEFKLTAADERSGKQLSVIQDLMGRSDVDRVINACDAGREGELIFAYIWQVAAVEKPVERLWISSLTPKAIHDGFGRLRPSVEMKRLEEAARSRAEADWLIGMNATRAATIRGRVANSRLISLGRVQTPTLALLARREVEIQGFVPQDYWLVDATFGAEGRADYVGRWFAGEETRLQTAEDAEAIVAKTRARPGVVASIERKEQTEAPPLLYDLTSLQRDANRRFGFPASRTLRAAQSLYEDKKALTYPRTASRYVPSDLIPQLKPIAETLTSITQFVQSAQYVLGLEKLPLGRVVDDAKIGDHHAIIPTVAAHAVEKFGGDEQRIFDLVARRFLAVFHPPARYARTTVVTEVEGETFRTQGRITLEVGWRGVYGAVADEPGPHQDDEEERGELPPLERGQPVRCVRAEADMRTTKPPARFTEATLLSAMETAGKLVDDEALREALKASGLGTPATRADTIETLINREYVERHGRELTPTPKGMQIITLLGDHPLTSAELTGDWEKRLNEIEQGLVDRPGFMRSIADFTRQTVEQIVNLEPSNFRPERVELGPCPRCGDQTGSIIRENSKAFGCTSWKSKDESGCGFVIWKKVARRTITAQIARELIEHGRTSEVLAGFRSKAGKSFRARLLLDSGGQVTFDMPARPGGEQPRADGEASPVAPGSNSDGDGAVNPSSHGTPNGAAVPDTDRALSSAGRSPTGRRAPDPKATVTVEDEAHTNVTVSPTPIAGDADLVEHLRQAGLEVIDKRPAGSLWVVDGDPPSPALSALRDQGAPFTFTPKGGRATRHRPGWWLSG